MSGINRKINLVILDANFILLPIQFKIDYLGDISDQLEGKIIFIVFKQILDELDAKMERIKNKDAKFETQYKSGLLYLKKNDEKYNIEYEKIEKLASETTDQFLLRKAQEFRLQYPRVFIGTNDYDLRKKAKKSKISVIFLRQGNYLSITRS